MEHLLAGAYTHKRHRRALCVIKSVHDSSFKSRHRGLPRGRPPTSHIKRIRLCYSHYNLPSNDENPKVWLDNLVKKWFSNKDDIFKPWDMDVISAAIQEASREEFATHFVSITECNTKNGNTIVVKNNRKEIEEPFKGSKTGVMLMCTAFGGNEAQDADELEAICKKQCTRSRKLIAALRFCVDKKRRIRFDERLFDPKSQYYCVNLVNAMILLQNGGMLELEKMRMKAPIER